MISLKESDVLNVISVALNCIEAVTLHFKFRNESVLCSEKHLEAICSTSIEDCFKSFAIQIRLLF